MRLAALLVVVVGCNGADDAPFTGPATLTLEDSSALGVIISDPRGIECGTCNQPNPSMCPDQNHHNSCAADFEAGTMVSLRITQQSIYFTQHCTSPALATIDNCTFVIDMPMSVAVMGVEAAR